MKSDEKRSHRLNYLLKHYLTNPQEKRSLFESQTNGRVWFYCQRLH